ncbi:MAG TPA: type II toxin-antitoxin system prevent-host-death family antitoxin [Opitutaceae bacterium]
MKSTTVRELRNNYAKVLKWVAKGEEVEVTRRGTAVAKVVPVSQPAPSEVDWSKSAALNRKPWSTMLTSEQSAAVLAESQGS